MLSNENSTATGKPMFFLFLCAVSQDNSTFTPLKTVNESTLFGVGKTFLDDTYLSPLTYNGLSMTLLHDRIRATRHFNGSMLLQQQFSIQVAITKNPTASASEYYGNLDYILSGYYPVARSSRSFSMAAGGRGGIAWRHLQRKEYQQSRFP